MEWNSQTLLPMAYGQKKRASEILSLPCDFELGRLCTAYLRILRAVLAIDTAAIIPQDISHDDDDDDAADAADAAAAAAAAAVSAMSLANFLTDGILQTVSFLLPVLKARAESALFLPSPSLEGVGAGEQNYSKKTLFSNRFFSPLLFSEDRKIVSSFSPFLLFSSPCVSYQLQTSENVTHYFSVSSSLSSLSLS